MFGAHTHIQKASHSEMVKSTRRKSGEKTFFSFVKLTDNSIDTVRLKFEFEINMCESRSHYKLEYNERRHFRIQFSEEHSLDDE